MVDLINNCISDFLYEMIKWEEELAPSQSSYGASLYEKDV